MGEGYCSPADNEQAQRLAKKGCVGVFKNGKETSVPKSEQEDKWKGKTENARSDTHHKVFWDKR